MLPTWVVERGEALSFLLVVVLLMLCARIVARVLGVTSRLVDDQVLWGILIFLLAGRLTHLALTTPALLADLMVAVRFTDGLQPLSGAAGVLAWSWWRGRSRQSFGEHWGVAACGLVIASVAYDLGCPIREACMGATAPAPWGIPLHGLTEPRLPTPLIDAIALLLVLAASVRVYGRWRPARMGWALLAALAATRLMLTPLSAGGADAVVMAVLAVIVAVSAVMAWRADGKLLSARRPMEGSASG